MIDKIIGSSSKKTEDDKGIDKAILDAVVNIATRDKGNILFLFSDESYEKYTLSKEELRNYFIKNRQNIASKQRTNSMDMTYSLNDSELTIRNTVDSIKKDFANAAAEKKYFDRLIFSVFTESRAELNEVAAQCLTLEGVNVYIL